MKRLEVATAESATEVSAAHVAAAESSAAGIAAAEAPTAKVALHAAAALYHQHVRHDGVLARMAPWLRRRS